MKHQTIKDTAKIWIVSGGEDAKLQQEFDPQFLMALGSAHSAEEIANVLVIEAGRIEVAESRLW